MWKRDLNDQFDYLLNDKRLPKELKTPFQKVITFFELDNSTQQILSMHAGFAHQKPTGYQFEIVLYTNKESKKYQVILDLDKECAYIKILG